MTIRVEENFNVSRFSNFKVCCVIIKMVPKHIIYQFHDDVSVTVAHDHDHVTETQTNRYSKDEI
jgi:hypothetical protein